jgi:hypothetical protein
MKAIFGRRLYKELDLPGAKSAWIHLRHRVEQHVLRYGRSKRDLEV